MNTLLTDRHAYSIHTLLFRKAKKPLIDTQHLKKTIVGVTAPSETIIPMIEEGSLLTNDEEYFS